MLPLREYAHWQVGLPLLTKGIRVLTRGISTDDGDGGDDDVVVPASPPAGAAACANGSDRASTCMVLVPSPMSPATSAGPVPAQAWPG